MNGIRQAGLGRSVSWAWLVLLAALFSGGVWAQAAPGGLQGDVAGQKAVHDFVLTEGFLHKVEALSAEADRMKVRPSIDASKVRSLADMAHELESTPSAKQLLDRNGLTAHEYLAGTFALAGAAMTVAMQEDPQMARYVDASRVNPANLKFYQQHRAEIDKLLHLDQPPAPSSAP